MVPPLLGIPVGFLPGGERCGLVRKQPTLKRSNCQRRGTASSIPGTCTQISYAMLQMFQIITPIRLVAMVQLVQSFEPFQMVGPIESFEMIQVSQTGGGDGGIPPPPPPAGRPDPGSKTRYSARIPANPGQRRGILGWSLHNCRGIPSQLP